MNVPKSPRQVAFSLWHGLAVALLLHQMLFLVALLANWQPGSRLVSDRTPLMRPAMALRFVDRPRPEQLPVNPTLEPTRAELEQGAGQSRHKLKRAPVPLPQRQRKGAVGQRQARRHPEREQLARQESLELWSLTRRSARGPGTAHTSRATPTVAAGSSNLTRARRAAAVGTGGRAGPQGRGRSGSGEYAVIKNGAYRRR